MDFNSKQNISPLSKLSTFISRYPDQNLHKQLQILQHQFPTHRAIRGDGNCFYRAFAFLYLSINSCSSFPSTFPKTSWNYLNPNSQIRSDKQFQQQLFLMWQRYIRHMAQVSRPDKEKMLQTVFNDISIFDELMIGYFRSINYEYLKKKRSEYREFTKSDDDFANELQRVRTFGAQSQGIEIRSLADAFDVKITIFVINQNSFQPVEYNQMIQNEGYYFFFRPGHYDIVYQDQLKEQTPKPKTDGLFKNIKTKFTNKFKLSPSQRKIQDDRNKLEEKAGNSSKQINSQNINMTNKIPRNSEQGLMTTQRKRTYFSSEASTNDGKYDINFRTSEKQKDAQKSSQTISKVISIKKPKRVRIGVTSWNDPLQKLMMELLGVGALAISGYVIYNYW